MIILKICKHCKKEFSPTTEFFRINRHKKDGLDTICKICRKELDKPITLKKTLSGYFRRRDTYQSRKEYYKRRNLAKRKSKSNRISKRYAPIIRDAIFGGEFNNKIFTIFSIFNYINKELLIKIKRTTVSQNIRNLVLFGFLKMIGRGIQREYPGVGGTTNFYKIIEKINVDLNTSDQYIEEIILTHKFKNNIFTSPEIQSICETDSWKVFGVLKEMQESQKICPIGYTGRNAIAYKLNPTKEDLEMSEKFMKDKLIEKLGYLPPLKEVARITVMETQWPRGIFTARDVAKASGLPRYSISSSLNDLKSEGIIEVIGRTGKSLNVYRIIKKEDQL